MLAEKTFQGRIALVTGASRGIGRAAALVLAQAGAHVVAVARTVGGLEELDDEIKKTGGSATLVPLDLKDFDGIDRMGAALYERWGRLDAFLGNAGVLGVVTPLTHLQPKIWDELIAVNVTANWRLIRSLDPLLRQSDGGRALFVSSGVARTHLPFFGRLCGDQGRAGVACSHLCRRMQRHQCESESFQSRPHAHEHARAGLPRRRPGNATAARGALAPDAGIAVTGMREAWRAGLGEALIQI